MLWITACPMEYAYGLGVLCKIVVIRDHVDSRDVKGRHCYFQHKMVLKRDWHRPGDHPSSEPMMVELTDTYMRHSATMSWMP